MSNARYGFRTFTTGEVRTLARKGVSQFVESGFFTDLFGMPAAAYSLRKLSPTSTNCIRVRRSNDNAEQDIGFVAGTPDSPIDTTDLLTFVGAGNDGFVTTWYDQSSSSNDAVQTTAGDQVRIVNSGSLDVDNSLAALAFGGTQFLQLTSTISTGKIMSIFSVSNSNKIVSTFIGSTSPTSNYNDDFGQHTINADGAFAQVAGFQQGQRIRTILRNNSTTNEIYQNNTLFTLTIPNNDFTIKEIGRRANLPANAWGGWMQELIIYTSSKSADRTTIETNQDNYHNVL
jgi:hypothetical protein